ALEMVAAAFALKAFEFFVDSKASTTQPAGGGVEEDFPLRLHFQKRHLIELTVGKVFNRRYEGERNSGPLDFLTGIFLDGLKFVPRTLRRLEGDLIRPFPG